MAIKIFIDQGHNPVNPNAGAEGSGYREQDLVYQIGIELAQLLRDDPNYEVVLSRPTPETQKGTTILTSLAARVNEANNWPADYFLSLHANASVIAGANGLESFVYSTHSSTYVLAQDINQGLSDATGIPNKGVYARPSLYVLRKTSMPAVLVEMGFITNQYEADLMHDNPALFAKGIYNGLNKYFGL